jgi:hypothetical protein
MLDYTDETTATLMHAERNAAEARWRRHEASPVVCVEAQYALRLAGYGLSRVSRHGRTWWEVYALTPPLVCTEYATLAEALAAIRSRA